MIKVVIVDDEILIRVGIKSSLNWEEHGFNIVGQAENGIKALEVIEATQPHIVLTDIKMPKMDGLQLINEIKNRYPGIKTVVLSCLNEIDYVKKAIKLGAEDYILKLTVEPESLLEVLTRVTQVIESEAQNDTSFKNSGLKTNQYVIKENVYRKMIAGSIGCEDFAKEISSSELEIRSSVFITLCCGIDDNLNAPKRSKMDDRYLLKFSFINILQESLSGYYKCDIAEIEDGQYIILLKCLSPSNSEFDKDTIFGCLKKINNSIKKYLNISVSFGVYPVTIDFTGIRDAYSKARMAMRYRFYRGNESIVFFDDVAVFNDKLIYFDNNKENTLIEKLEDFDETGVKAIINQFYDRISESGIQEPDCVRKVSVDVFNTLIEFVKRFGIKDDLISSNLSVHPLDFLMTAETLFDIRQWLGEFVDSVYEYIYGQQYEAKRPEIIKLKKYITENISENITLEKASKISNISKCYLSSIFKKETGDAFVDYVNKAKMERAKILIQQHGLKIYEAALKVGINDDSYFSKLFKKYIGISPSKFLRVNNYNS